MESPTKSAAIFSQGAI